jgi:hypothetical protein
VIRQGFAYMQDFNCTTLFASDGSLRSSLDVIKAFNRGCGFLWFFGGATPERWGVYLPNRNHWTYILGNYQIPFLVNHEKLPILLDGSGCHNCMFNISFGNSFDFQHFRSLNWGLRPALRCMGELLLTAPHGGCIAVFGPAAIGHDSTGILSGKGGCDWLEINFLKEYDANKTTLLGDAWSNTLCSYLQNFTIDWADTTSNDDSVIVKAAQAWSLFGDPTLHIGGYAGI